MFTKTFSTTSNKQGWANLEVSLDFPSDPSEVELIEARFGSLGRVFEEAAASAVIACQTGMRDKATKKEAAEYAESFCDDGSRRAPVRTISAEDAEKFDPEQLAMLRAKYGMKVAE